MFSMIQQECIISFVKASENDLNGIMNWSGGLPYN
jgi:hypothetical protein